MKWCIIVGEPPVLMELLGKVSEALLEQGDECVLVYSSKYAEYEKARYFPKGTRNVSKVDWLLEHYNPFYKDYGNLTWRPLYTEFDRAETRGDLWPWGYQDSSRRLAQDYQFFEWLFQEEQPDAILFEPPAGVTAHVAYVLAAKFRIPYLGLVGSRIPERLVVYDSEYTDSRYLETFRKLRLQDISEKELKFADRFIREFLSHKQLPSYEGFLKVRFTPVSYILHYMRRVKQVGGPLWRYMRQRKKFKRVDFESEHSLAAALKAPLELALAQVRTVLQRGLYRSMGAEDNFYLFPVHLQPEASTSVQAMHYSDQAATIRHIASALPFPCKLYVKEHPSALGTKPASFYRKIQNIPNAVLVSPYESTPELVRRCLGVVTLTGTVGMEAVMAGKPVYALGEVFYEYHPLCRTPKNFDELREQILRDYKHGARLEDLQEQNRRFVISYLRNTFSGVEAGALAERDPNNYPEIARELQKTVQEKQRSLKHHA